MTAFSTSHASSCLICDAWLQIGTLCWCAPEVLEGSRYGLPCDVYSFAILLWEIETCRMPFEDIKRCVCVCCVVCCVLLRLFVFIFRANVDVFAGCTSVASLTAVCRASEIPGLVTSGVRPTLPPVDSSMVHIAAYRRIMQQV